MNKRQRIHFREATRHLLHLQLPCFGMTHQIVGVFRSTVCDTLVNVHHVRDRNLVKLTQLILDLAETR